MKILTIIIIGFYSLISYADYKQYKKLNDSYFNHSVKIKLENGKTYKAGCVGHSFVNEESFGEYIFEFDLKKIGNDIFADNFHYRKRNFKFLDFLLFPYPEDKYTFTKSNNGNYTSVASSDPNFYLGIRYKKNQIALEQMISHAGANFINNTNECVNLKACKWEFAQSTSENYAVGYSICNLTVL